MTRKISTDVCVVVWGMNQLREQRIIEAAGTEPVRDGELPMRVNFAYYHSVRLPIEVPQPMLLRTLADAAAVYRHFMLVRSAGATELLRSGGKVTGVSARTPDAQIEVPARLTAGADGRYSNVLDWPGVAVRKLPMNRDDTYRPRFAGAGHATCVPTGGNQVRAGIAKSGLRSPRPEGIEPLYSQVNAPELAVRDHMVIDRGPGLKRRIRRDPHSTLSPRAEPARQPVRST
jgi:hypothetical protein